MVFTILSISFTQNAFQNIASASLSSPRDESSYANIDEVETQHLSLDLMVDFERRMLSGSVTLKMLFVVDAVDHFYLDIKGIDV